jgi:peptide/nickel transport system substrate-binding protein
MRKAFLVFLAVLLAGSAVSFAVLGQEVSQTMKNPNTIVVDTIPGWNSIDPAYAYDTSSGEIIFNVYEGLIQYDGGSTSQFKPMLATEVPSTSNGLITVASNGKTEYIDFPIRQGVTFHNGDVLTPEDVAYSLQRLIIVDRSAGPAWMIDSPLLGTNTFADYVEKVASDLGVKAQFDKDLKAYDASKPSTYTATMKKVDTQACENVQNMIKVKGNEVEITLPNPVPYFLEILAHSATWASIVDKAFVTSKGGWDGSPATWRKYTDPKKENMALYDVENGTGPWKIQNLNPTTGYTLVRYDNYWNKSAYPSMFATDSSGNYLSTDINKVVENYTSEWSDRRLAFQHGDADIVYCPPQYKEQLMGMKGARTLGYLPAGEDVVTSFNFDIPTQGNSLVGSGKLDGNGIPANFFQDIDVRKGFEYCFDWPTFIKDALVGEGVQARGPIVNAVKYYNPNQAVYSLDLEKATQYFKKAFDGKLWQVGFTMTLTWNTGNDTRKTAAEILANNLMKVNPKFHLKLTSQPWPTFLDNYISGKLPLYTLGWLWDYPDASDWVQPYLGSQGAYGGPNHISALGDLSKQLDQLITQAANTLDTATRKADYYKIQEIAYDQALGLYIADETGRNWQRTWVNDYEYNPIWSGFNFAVMSKDPNGGTPNYSELLQTVHVAGAQVLKNVQPGETVIGTWDAATKTADGIVIQQW